ncbi:MAG: basic membrane lipoprotein Med (substrate-binding protein (PBP1-ABC) superfamily) [Verrucomicrobiales bacterium]|jgi:basic membrane lipoprotein Med (substrate-binding protein (PBP1-ABC) superfamily)
MKKQNKGQLVKLLATLFAITLTAAACGGDAAGTATSECGSDLAVAKGDSVTDLTVALVAPSAENDVAFTQSMVDSLTRLGIEPQITDGTFVVEDAAAAIRAYAEDGVDIVIAHGTQYGGSLAEIAPDFPGTSFIWGTATDTQGLPNVFAYFPEADQGGYVNGVIAASLSDQIGVVGPVDAGDAVAYINGFIKGAEANGASTSVVYTGSFSDVALAQSTAEAHAENGVGVLTGTSQSAVGAVNVATENDLPWFGTQSNTEAWESDLTVASQVYHWDVVLSEMIEQIEDGTLGGSAMGLTLENGGLVMEFNGCYDLDSSVKGDAEAAIEDIIAGDIVTK